MKSSLRSSGLLCLFYTVTATFMVSTACIRAQTWQWEYGTGNCNERGQLRVIPVDDCNGTTDGYIAVGVSSSINGGNCNLSNTYVVRTDNSGAKMWEYTYDVGNDGEGDQAYSVIQLDDNSGFIVVGTANMGTYGPQAYLMELDCDGNVQWVRDYGSQITPEVGFDVIEATTGNGLTTNAGDLVVCGIGFNNVYGNEDGLIFRTTSNGTLIWSRRYNTHEAAFENFFSLTEATVTGTPGGGMQTTGDIIAVGVRITGPVSGIAVRVNGDNGSITPIAPLQQNCALYGPDSGISFRSVIELQNPSETGTSGYPNVVVVGECKEGSYLVKFDDGNPCDPAAQRWIGDNRFGDADRADGIVEIPFAMNLNLPAWTLAYVGLTSDGENSPSVTDVVVQPINPGTLVPAGMGVRYDPRPGDDLPHEGHSLYPVPLGGLGGRTQGFVICGVSTESGPTQQMYLIKTDEDGQAGGSGCYLDYDPDDGDPDYPLWCITPQQVTDIPEFSTSAPKIERDWGEEQCTEVGGGIPPGGGGSDLSLHIQQKERQERGGLESNGGSALIEPAVRSDSRRTNR